MKKKMIATIIIIIIILLIITNLYVFDLNKKNENIEKYQSDKRNLFGPSNINHTKLLVYQSNMTKIKVGGTRGIGYGIKNSLPNMSKKNATFDYEVVLDNNELENKCKNNETEIFTWITLNKSGTTIPVPSGHIVTEQIIITIPKDTNPCRFRLRINIKYNGEDYASDFMDMEIKE